jgi:DNA-binding NtrC family response regulator
VIRRPRFNAILLGLGPPDGDGLDGLKDIQQLDPSLPVVILTAHVSAERTVGSLTTGAFACVTKPFNGEELRHTLRRAGDHVACEHRAGRSDGRLHRLQWFIWTGHVLRDRRGQAVHVLGTVRAAPVAGGA